MVNISFWTKPCQGSLFLVLQIAHWQSKLSKNQLDLVVFQEKNSKEIIKIEIHG